MNTALIGIGTNMGDRLSHLRESLRALSMLPDTKLVQLSHIYETKPVGFAAQPDFLNCVVEVDTGLSPSALLGACLGIEAGMGRVRDLDIRNVPRVIDLDLLIYEHVKTESRELTLPHPRILERAFVMRPLMDLYPSGRAPGLYFGAHLKETDQSGVTLYEEQIEL